MRPAATRPHRSGCNRAGVAGHRLLRIALLAGACLLAGPAGIASEFEPSAPIEEEERWLDDDQLAAQLAAFLWRSAPDEELRTLAAGRQLHRPDVLRAQAARLLADARSRDFVNAFLEHWLQLGAAPNARSDGDAAGAEKAQMIFARLLRENRSLSALLDAPVPLLQRRLEAHVPGARAEARAPLRLARSLARSLVAFARGAPLRESDALAVEDILARSKVDGYRLGSLVHEVVQSELFQTR